MRFSSSERVSAKTPKEEEEDLKKQVDELAAKNNELFLEQGLLEWHIEEKEKEYRKQEEEHGRDPLTGAHTRKFFDTKFKQEFAILNKKELREGAKPLTEVSLIFIDLDHFKEVNDTLGHAQGDEVLKRAVRLLQSALREEDILARYGGDEFVVLLPNEDETKAANVAEKLRTALDSDTQLKKLGVTGSFGAASSRLATSAENLIECADKAVYAAKEGGRNRVEIYSGT